MSAAADRPAWIKFVSTIMAPLMGMCAILFTHQSYAGTTTWVAPAPTGAAAGGWATHAANAANWVDWPGSTVSTPKDNFRQLAEMKWTRSTGTFDMRMIDGEQWMTLGRAEAGKLGLNANEVSNRVNRFPSNSAYVFAAYSPENAELRVEIHKIERGPDGIIRTFQADFTPWHGERWKGFGAYRTGAQKFIGAEGYNPFGNFMGASTADPVFHNIGFSGAQVVVGHAMRHYKAVLGFLAPTKNRFGQTSSTSGGLFSSKTTTTVTGYSSIADWYIATPVELQQDGAISAGICVVPSATTQDTCDAPEHLALAGVSFAKWSGGNLPGVGQEEKVYEWTQTTSSFSVAFFAVILAVVTWGVGAVLIQAGMASTVLGMSAAQAALAVGVGYAALSTAGVFGGGGNLTTTQHGAFGTTGNGVVVANPAANGQHSAGMAQGIHNRHVAPVEGFNLNGMTSLFKGACPEGQTVQQCQAAGLDPGLMWRPDSYRDYNTTLEMRQKWDDCVAQGRTGVALRMCATPGQVAW